MKLKVKELRDYLHLHEVSTHLCREKVRVMMSLFTNVNQSGERIT